MPDSVPEPGYIKYIEHWGSDKRIIEAARMSTNKGFKGWPKDEKLLGYLWRNKHYTPFEMAGMVLEIKAPIFVFREWHRHRTQSYNEMSARYTPLPDENYIPTLERIKMDGGKNKQAVGVGPKISDVRANIWLKDLRFSYLVSQNTYAEALVSGVPKELARLSVPAGRYSKMRASANLRNWLAFLSLRMAPEAQWEIRQYANDVAEHIELQFPRTYALFHETALSANVG
jgi:thymidylate synthase (FAD)